VEKEESLLMKQKVFVAHCQMKSINLMQKNKQRYPIHHGDSLDEEILVIFVDLRSA